MTTHEGSRQEIVVLAENHEPVFFGDRPDALVIVTRETEIPDVHAAGKSLPENVDEPEGEILVQQRLHATDPSKRRPHSAANARQARMSSLVSSGKSAKISASVMPEAR